MKLNIPLRNELFEKLEKAIEEELKKCIQVINLYKKADYREDLAEEFDAQIEKIGFGPIINFLSKECKISRTDLQLKEYDIFLRGARKLI